MHTDEIIQAKPIIENWHHWLPFAALMARDVVPQNRPMATRLLEQALVGLIAGGGGAYGVNSSMQAVQAEQIQGLKEQVRDTETRLTAQIVELRARQLK
jgi:hypothetical protein